MNKSSFLDKDFCFFKQEQNTLQNKKEQDHSCSFEDLDEEIGNEDEVSGEESLEMMLEFDPLEHLQSLQGKEKKYEFFCDEHFNFKKKYKRKKRSIKNLELKPQYKNSETEKENEEGQKKFFSYESFYKKYFQHETFQKKKQKKEKLLFLAEKDLMKNYLGTKNRKRKLIENYYFERKEETKKPFRSYPNQTTIYPFTNYLVNSDLNEQMNVHSLLQQLLFSLTISENRYQDKHNMHIIETVFTKMDKSKIFKSRNKTKRKNQRTKIQNHSLEKIIDDCLVSLGFLFGIFNSSHSNKFNLEYNNSSQTDLRKIFEFYDPNCNQFFRVNQQSQLQTTKTIKQQKYESVTNYKIECMLRIIEMCLNRSLFQNQPKTYQLVFRFALQCFLTFPQYRIIINNILKQCLSKLGEQFTGNTAIYCFKFFNDLQLLVLLNELSPFDRLLRKEHLWLSSLALRNILGLTIDIIPEDLPKNIHQEIILSIELFQNKQINDQVVNLTTFIQLLYVLPLVHDLCLERENQKFCKKLRKIISDVRLRIRNSTKIALKIKEILLEIYVTLKNGEREMKAESYYQRKMKRKHIEKIKIKQETIPTSLLDKINNNNNRSKCNTEKIQNKLDNIKYGLKKKIIYDPNFNYSYTNKNFHTISCKIK
ncbi:hypothetical protein M0812_20798 [Anaeramoeba flamelloides]|uniref:Uncharacterized protein n=1 Tax=Anaeramoeba flamelloides TaxID=1746091 RepID=A0AAV7YWU4_9EUKA|nr:hypothetical protein M0812_20798 [Anaeramoeba flamelloides]